MGELHRKSILEYSQVRRMASDQRFVLAGLAAAMIVRLGDHPGAGDLWRRRVHRLRGLTVLFFGLAGLSVVLLRNGREEQEAFGRGEDDGESVSIFTGNLPRRDARVQLLIVPAAVAVGFLALALVDFIDRLVMTT